MIGIKSNPQALSKIIACLNNDRVNFFDHKAVDDCLTSTVMHRFNLRVWHEAIFLNGFYVDWFNSNRCIHSMTVSYDLTIDECKAMLELAQSVHELIHVNLDIN